ncbi:IS1 family transposase [Escherichia coli]|uniref:IS1 family transposase n=1 Tax=Escherichia coli TaxID=562 RepID=UPI00235903FA|nr:IS1 family transposase [Escherichia coli]MDC9105775.1 IS1 family transposase [Escherichia coli]
MNHLKEAARNQQAIIYAAGERHNLNLRAAPGTAGTEVAVVLKIPVELHDKVIGHYLNIKHYQ